MAITRRVGTAQSKTRALILDCAERLLLKKGYASLSYRTLGTEAGVTGALVQYYFPTFDDLFVALVRDRSERTLKTLTAGLDTDHPLRAIWDYANNKHAAALTAELMAAANHRKRLRAEIAQAGEQARAAALEAVSRTTENCPWPAAPIPLEVLVFLITSTPRMIVMERSMGIKTSLDETIAYFERFLDEVEPLDGTQG
ncbi:TetR/AcrR family transcriptional regulator [Streptomyces sp. NPDC102360]|uniref:TetR/AcrR family transcriptional regulator n=1 Tax=Streptomyces sp. NPDC102360 TaxID=3366160 RepID=UPI003805FF1D